MALTKANHRNQKHPIRAIAEGFGTLRLDPSDSLSQLRDEMQRRQGERMQLLSRLFPRSTKSSRSGSYVR